jgi:protein HIRA/HIR1
VNCVRFAPLGNALATAGDDHLIFIWRQHDDAAVAPQRVFGTDVVVHEKWIVRLTLRAHAGDVVDLAWSPGADLLVSCSLREELFVWNVAADERGASVPIARLVGHQGNIKGVAWDPIGRYIASAGDDCTVRVWRVADWGQEAVIRTPFEESTSNFYYRRLSWSPDGQMLACANGVNSKMPVAPVIERGKWVSTRELVGHRQPVVVTAFNPALFQTAAAATDDDDDEAVASKKRRTSSKKKDATVYAMCAIGSADNGLSIWTTHKQRSVMVATNVHIQSIVDLVWDRSTGDMLACTSTDGTVSFYLFHDKDLDQRLSQTVVRDRLRQLYGDAATAGAIDALPEDPELMLGVDDSMHSNSSHPHPPTAAARAVAAPLTAVTRVVNEQTVSVVGGKRRIHPATLVADLVETSGAAASTTQVRARPTLTPMPSSTQSNSSFAQALATAPLVTTTAVPMSRPPTIVITPSANGAATSNASAGAAASAAAAAKRKRVATNDAAVPQESSNFGVASSSTTTTTAPGVAATTFWLTSNAAPAQRVVRQVSVDVGEQLLIDADVAPTSASATAPTALPATTVQCVLGTQVQWTARLAQRVTHIAGTASWIALGCDDGTLLLRSSKGRLLVPALVLDAPVVALEASRRDYLLAVTADGGVAVWHVGRLTRTVTSSVRSLFAATAHSVVNSQPPSPPHLVSASVGEDGIPVVTLPTYESFVFHPSMLVWLRAVDRRHLHSEHSSVLPLGRPEDAAHQPVGPASATAGLAVTELREQAKRSASVAAELITAGRSLLAARNGPVYAAAGTDDALAASIEHIEHRLATALLLGPIGEKVRWVRIYARNAGNGGLQERLQELLTHLVGRPPAQHNSVDDAPSAERREMWQLAHEALAVIRPMRALQRLFTEFSAQLRSHEQSK